MPRSVDIRSEPVPWVKWEAREADDDDGGNDVVDGDLAPTADFSFGAEVESLAIFPMKGGSDEEEACVSGIDGAVMFGKWNMTVPCFPRKIDRAYSKSTQTRANSARHAVSAWSQRSMAGWVITRQGGVPANTSL
mmetsp:Transcript_29947/g.58534  ORF Transcript_29947/g.58534 Transcript_29947/m.58534 type:complete len:135 (+) Transcript_29947:901-1305(+)